MEETKKDQSVEDRRWCVYIHTNVHNGKKYIGYTNNIGKRFGQNGIEYLRTHPDGTYKHPVFAYAILKYNDWENDWIHTIFAERLTQQEAAQKEIELIALYKTNCSKYKNPEYGYNLTDGGDGKLGCSYCMSEEHKNKISIALSGDNNPMYGKHHSEEHKNKISQKLKGKTLSEDNKQKLIEAKLKPVVQLTKSGKFVSEYNSRVDAATIMGISKSHIGSCCNNERITAGGFLWINKDEYDPLYAYSYEERRQIYHKKLKEKEFNI